MTTVKIDWMKNWANSPRIELLGIKVPTYPAENDPIWQKTADGLHIARKGVFAFYFYSNGKPTEGFGGRRFAGTFMDGTTFEYKGAWSSRAGCINAAVQAGDLHGDYIVDVVVGSCATAVDSSWLLAVAVDQDIDLTFKNWDTEPVLEPTHKGLMKGDEGFVFPE